MEGNKNLKIAIVEDNEGDAVLIKEMLDYKDVEIMHFKDLDSALENFEKNQFDIALVDLGLPGCVGSEAPMMIMNENPTLPVIALTGSDDARIIQKVLSIGAQDYLIKGRFDKDTLIRSIRYSIERKKVYDKLNSQKQFSENIINTAKAVILVIDHTNRIIKVNEFFREITGYRPEEAKNKNFIDNFVTKDFRISTKEILLKSYSEDPDTAFVNSVAKKDGGSVFVEWHFSVMKDKDENTTGLLCVGLDITEKKDLEEQLRQSQKMEAIGLLAGGIAHDFNNLLMVILCNCDLMLARSKKDDPLIEDIVEIKKSGQRAAELTRQLLAFSRKQVLKPQIIDINMVVNDLEKMIKRLIGEKIELVSVLNPDLTTVKTDRGQLDQVIMNLVVNARDAMPKGGKITIETANVKLSNDYIKKYSDFIPGNYVMMAVTDTGTGMSKEIVDKIFEPFFTTKGIGKGTGLGLSTVYGIVKQSCGYIYCYSEPGVGTTFKIYLPFEDDEIISETKPKSPQELVSHGEKIVIIDDEKEIRDIVTRMLEQEGYEIFVAENYNDVMKHFKMQKIDLLITDVIMPELNGDELGEKLLEKYPGTKIIYMSGYTESTIMDFSLLDKNKVYLQKPFTRQYLVQNVKEILNN